MPVELTSSAKVLSVQPVWCSQGSLQQYKAVAELQIQCRHHHKQLAWPTRQVPELQTHNAGTSTNSSHGQLEAACCQRLNSLAEVLSVGVACSLKGPPSEQIIKLLGTMYRLLKSATLLTKAPPSGSPSAFHTLIQTGHQLIWHVCVSHLYDTGHVIWHACLSHSHETLGISFGISASYTCVRHWACHVAHVHFTFHETAHSTSGSYAALQTFFFCIHLHLSCGRLTCSPSIFLATIMTTCTFCMCRCKADLSG